MENHKTINISSRIIRCSEGAKLIFLGIDVAFGYRVLSFRNWPFVWRLFLPRRLFPGHGELRGQELVMLEIRRGFIDRTAGRVSQRFRDFLKHAQTEII
jgi:hypothetical protein